MRTTLANSACLWLSLASVVLADPGSPPVASAAPIDRVTSIGSLTVAIRLFEAVGCNAFSETLRERLRLEQQTLRAELLRSKLAELERLQAEVDGLRKLADSPRQVCISVRWIEVDRAKLPNPKPEVPGKCPHPFDDVESLPAFDARIQELADRGIVKVLAEPDVVTLDGKRVNFESGGAFPIPSSERDPPVEMKHFGIFVDAVPQVLGGGRVSLEITTECSAPDMTAAVKLAGNVVPGLKVRRFRSHLELNVGRPQCLGGCLPFRRSPDGSMQEVMAIVTATTIDDAVDIAEPSPPAPTPSQPAQ